MMTEKEETIAIRTAGDSSHATKVLLVLTGVALLVNYVETMVIPGIPTIQKDLSTTASIASWITSSYLIVGSVVSPLFGKLGDIYGKKKMFLVSLIFYICGVGVAGFSPSIYILLLARALQGVGFAIIPLSLAIITDVFPRERVGTAQGIISGTFAIGAAAGLIVGSYVIQDLGWPYAFHSALVLSLILFFATMKVLPRDVLSATKRKVAYVDAAVLMGGVTLLLLYATEGPSLGWLSLEELGFLIIGAALTLLFFVLESRGKNPLIDLGLLRIKNVFVANLVGIISGISMFLLFFAVVYYSEAPPTFGLNLDIVAAGLTLAPSTVGMLIAGPVLGKMLTKFGPKPVLILGSGLLGLGLLMFIFNRSSATDVSIDMLVSLGGVVSIIIPIVNMIALSIPRESTAVGLGMNTMLRNLGGAIGPVLATTIMATYTSPLMESINGHIVTVAQLPNAMAFNTIFFIGIVLTVMVFAVSLATKNYTFGSKQTKT